MELSPFGVRASSGSLRVAEGIALQHAWTLDGVVASPVTNGAQTLHLSVALCILNDIHREAEKLGLRIDGVTVAADGAFDPEWRSTGITYDVALDTPADARATERLLDLVDEVAEIPRAVRAGATVTRARLHP